MKQESREEQFFMSTEEPEDIQVSRTADEFIYDNNGKRYIDFNAGWCVGNLGWKRREIQSKLKSTKIPDYIVPDSAKMFEKRIAVYYTGKYSHFFSSINHAAVNCRRRFGYSGKLSCLSIN